MSSEDKRIVTLEFDNSKFDKNVEKSNETLKKLKENLKLDGASKGLDAISSTAKRFDISNIGQSIGTVTTKFSALEVVGKRVLENLTDSAMRFGSNLVNSIVDPIKSGGWRRAMNLEQANFQLEGLLGGSADGAEKIAAIMESVNQSVKGTAYGLDQAAKVASQFVATGIEDADQMLSYLKGVAGAAAMTGRNYDDIGRIFTTVAGQGRLMGDQLLQFASSGLNVAATLSKQMNITEAEFRDMVSKGEISFDEFAAGMAEAFGEHATKANETFTGSLSNMRAALARIGAEVATPALRNFRDIFNSLRPLIDNVHEALKPFINTLNFDFSTATKNTVKTLGWLNDKLKAFLGDSKKTAEETEEVADSAAKAAEEIEKVAREVISGKYGSGDERRAQLEALGYSYEEVQNKVNELSGSDFRYEVQAKETTKTVKKSSSAFKDLRDKIDGVKEAQEKIGQDYRERASNNFFAGIRKFIVAFGQYGSIVKTTFESVFTGSLSKKIYDIAYRFREFADSLKLNETQSEGLKTVFTVLFTILKGGLGVVGFIINKFLTLTGVFTEIRNKVLEFIAGFDKTNKAFDETSRKAKLVEAIKVVFDKISESITAFKTTLKDAFDTFKQSDGFKHLHDSLTKLWDLVKSVAANVFDRFIDKLNSFNDHIPDTSWADKLADWLGKAADKLADFIDLIVSKKDELQGFIENIKNFFTGKDSSGEIGNGFIEGIKESLKNWNLVEAFTGLKDAIIDGVGTNIEDAMEDSSILENIKSYFTIIADALSKIDWGFVLKHLTKALMVFGVLKTLLSMSKMFNSVSDLVNGVSKKLNVKTSVVSSFKSFATAVLAIAASLLLISLIPPDELKKALITLGLISGVIFGVIGLFAFLGKKGKIDLSSANSMAKDFLQISISLAVLSLAVDKLGGMETGNIIKGELAIAGLVAIMAIAAKAIGTSKVAASSFLFMGLAVDALIPPMLVFSNMPTDKLVKGGLTIVSLLGSLAIATRIAKSAIVGAGAMAIMALAVNALIPPMIIFGNMPGDALIQGGLTIVSLLGSLAIATRIAKSAIGGAGAMAIMAIAVNALIPPMIIFGNMPGEKLLKGGVTIAALFGSLVIACKLARKNVRGALSMAIMAAPIVAAAVSLRVLAGIPFTSMLASAAVLSLVMLALAECTKIAESAVRGALSMALLVIPLTTVIIGLKVLSDAPVANILTAALGLSAVMLALAVAAKSASSTTMDGIVMMVALTIPLATVCIGLAGLAEYPWENILAAAVSLSAVFLAASAAIWILSKVPFSAGLIAIGLLDLFIISLAAIVAGIGKLFGEGGKWEGAMEKAIPVMESFGAAIGSFVSSIIDTIGESLASSLERFGEAIGNFGDSIQPFIDACSNIDESTLTGLDMLTTALLKITAAELLDALANFIGGNSEEGALVKFGEQIAAFGGPLSEFTESVAESLERFGEAIGNFGESIDPFIASVDAISDNTAEKLNTLAGALLEITASELIDQISNLIGGEGALSQFGEQLKMFGASIAEFAQAASSETLDDAIESVKTAAGIYPILKEAGIGGGLNALSNSVLGGPLTNIANELVSFSTIAQDIVTVDEATISSVKDALGPALDAYKLIKESGVKGGVFAFFEGNMMKNVATELKAFSDNAYNLEPVDKDTIVSIADSIEPSLAAFTSVKESDVKGGLSALLEGNMMKNLASEIKAFSEGAKGVESVDPEAIGTVSAAVGPAVEAYKSLADDSTIIQGGLYSFLGEELSDFADSVKDIESVNTDAINTITATLPDLTTCLKDISNASISESNVGSFGTSLVDVGGKLVKFSISCLAILTSKINSIVGVVPDIIQMTTDISNATTTNVEAYVDTLVYYGEKLRDYSDSIKNISTMGIAKAIESTYSLIEVGKAMAYVDTDSMSNFGAALKNVGDRGVDEFVSSFTDAYDRAADAAAGLVQASVNGIENGSSYYSWWNAGINCTQGFIDAIASGAASVYNTAWSVASAAMDAVQSCLGIFSPSREMYSLGEYAIEGFVNAFNDGSKMIFTAGNEMAETALKAVTKPVEMIQRLLNTNLDLTPTITPVIDLSNLESGTLAANGMLSGLNGQLYANTLSVGSIGAGQTDTGALQSERILDILSRLAEDDGVSTINNTFNITGDNPREIAEEVSKIIQSQVERRGATWA